MASEKTTDTVMVDVENLKELERQCAEEARRCELEERRKREAEAKQRKIEGRLAVEDKKMNAKLSEAESSLTADEE